MHVLNWLLAALLLTGPLTAAQDDTKTRATLLLATESARPGDTVLAALRLRMAPRWHTYWRNPGDSGLATSLAWTLPAGITAGEIQWPPAEAFESLGVTTFVYHAEVLLLIPLHLAATVPPGPVTLKAKASWLECETACVPGSAAVEARLTIGSESRPSADAALIEAWRKRLPADGSVLGVSAKWTSGPSGGSAELIIEGQSSADFIPTDFHPYAAETYELDAAVKGLPADPGRFRLAKTVKPMARNFPLAIPGILVQPAHGDVPAMAYEVTLRPPGSGGAAGTGAGVQTAGTVAADGPPPSLPFMLLLAFVGGLILNIMPCVLPVIALKILGFVQQSKEEPARVRWLGVMYAAGVVASFLVLAAAVISVQHAGRGASWGMQMQNPYFRLALLVIVTLVALNLFGVFEVTLGGGALGTAAKLASQEGSAGAFFNGVLATALATPCTAPFLTVALGFAFTQPAGIIVLMFVTTALGLAAPYVALSWNPAWLKFLPKPGMWMLRFKVAMGFPMLATALWLFDISAASYGESGVLWLGLFLTVLALIAWVWGEFIQRGTQRRGQAGAICALLAVFAYGYILESELRWRTPHHAGGAAGGVIRDSPEGIPWYPWSPEAVAAARAAGKPVLVDFTARWCLTCKSNKRLAVDIPSVRAELERTGTVAFRADYTDSDPRITEELQRHHRAGVPLTLVFPRNPQQPPQLLPAQLTPGIVLDALAAAAR